MTTIAVLLTVFNRREQTLECLRRLDLQSLPNDCRLKIFLTNDGCTDGTPEAVRSEFPHVNIIEGDGSLYWNRGMIAAWNAAAKFDPDFYLWLNDDTDLRSDAITLLIQTLQQVDSSVDPIVIGSCCATADYNCTTYGARTRSFRLITPEQMSRNELKAETFNGNIVLIPRSVYQRLGTLDHMFRHSLGDFDYGLRATAVGIPILIAPGHLGTCDTHSTIARWADPKRPLSQRWKHFLSPTGANPIEFFRFKRRHQGLIAASVTFITNIIHVLFPWLWK